MNSINKVFEKLEFTTLHDDCIGLEKGCELCRIRKAIWIAKSEIQEIIDVINGASYGLSKTITLKDKEIERLKEENKLLNREKLQLIRVKPLVEEANDPNTFCKNCGHPSDTHYCSNLEEGNDCDNDTCRGIHGCVECDEIESECKEFEPCDWICEIINARELRLQKQNQELKEKIRNKIKELEGSIGMRRMHFNDSTKQELVLKELESLKKEVDK